jgi:hypothetical protein
VISLITESVSAIAVVVSVLILARQTRKLAQQTDISNLMGRYEALHGASERYDNALALIFEHPELRPYIFEGKALTPDDPNRDRAMLVAGMMAGALDSANRVAKRFPDNEHQSGWQQMAIASAQWPVFRELLTKSPHEFLDLMRVVSDNASPLQENTPSHIASHCPELPGLMSAGARFTGCW